MFKRSQTVGAIFSQTEHKNNHLS